MPACSSAISTPSARRATSTPDPDGLRVHGRADGDGRLGRPLDRRRGRAARSSTAIAPAVRSPTSSPTARRAARSSTRATSTSSRARLHGAGGRRSGGLRLSARSSARRARGSAVAVQRDQVHLHAPALAHQAARAAVVALVFHRREHQLAGRALVKEVGGRHASLFAECIGSPCRSGGVRPSGPSGCRSAGMRHLDGTRRMATRAARHVAAGAADLSLAGLAERIRSHSGHWLKQSGDMGTPSRLESAAPCRAQSPQIWRQPRNALPGRRQSSFYPRRERRNVCSPAALSAERRPRQPPRCRATRPPSPRPCPR